MLGGRSSAQSETCYRVPTRSSYPERLSGLLARAAAGGPIAYVEDECFGGECAQASVVWEHGQIVLGPLIDPPSYRDQDRPPQGSTSYEHLPINQALRGLGVQRAVAAIDEFVTVGLDRYRSTNA